MGFLTSYKILLISFNGLINKNKVSIYYLPEAFLLFFCVVLDNICKSCRWIFSFVFFSASASSGEILGSSSSSSSSSSAAVAVQEFDLPRKQY